MSRHNAADRLFERSLIGMLVSAFLALAVTGELSLLALGLSIAGFSARLVLLLLHKPLPVPALAVNALVLLYAGFYPVDLAFFSDDFLAPTIRLICFVTVVKGLTFRSDRDALYAVLASFSQLLAAALLSWSLLFFVFLTAYLFCGVATFAAWEIRRGARGARVAIHASMRGFHRRLIAVSLSASIGILLFTGGLFFVLPRTARAALQNLVSQRFHLPGFGGEVDLRKIGEIQTSSRTIMFVKIANHGSILPLRWRGSAMSRFDGRRWTTNGDLADQISLRHGSASLPPRYHSGRIGTRERYEVQLAETGMNALFVAGIPETIEANISKIVVLSNGSLRGLSDMPAVLRYSVTSFFDERDGDGTPLLPREERRRFLEVPRNFDPRIISLAQQVAGTENNPALQSRRIAEYLQRTYPYTLELPGEEIDDPIAHFLFERKKGHCEYFASSMALLLRSIGIPSRVVTGFQGGTLNPVSGWYTVKASDAHSWVEAFLPGNGWTAFDPTPASRQEPGFAFFTRLSQLVEAADLFWQDWIVQYDLDRQFRLAAQLEQSRFGTRSRTLFQAVHGFGEWGPLLLEWLRSHLILLLAGAIGVAAAWFGAPWLRSRVLERKQRERFAGGGARASDATLLYRKMLTLLEANDIRKPAWFTPLEFARKLPPSELSLRIAAFTHAYHRVRYGHDSEAASQMLSLYDAIEAAIAAERTTRAAAG